MPRPQSRKKQRPARCRRRWCCPDPRIQERKMPLKSKPASGSPRSRKRFSLFRTQGKIAALRNRLLKEAVIEGVAITALVAAYYMLSDWVDGRIHDRDNATAQLSQITADADSLQ